MISHPTPYIRILKQLPLIYSPVLAELIIDDHDLVSLYDHPVRTIYLTISVNQT